MKKYHGVLAGAVLLAGLSNGYAETTTPLLSETQKIQSIADLISSIDLKPNAVWKDFHFNSLPTLIYFKDSRHLYAFDFQPQTPGWQKSPVHYGDKTVYYLPQHDPVIADYTYNSPQYTYMGEQKAYVIPMGDYIDHTADLESAEQALVGTRFIYYTYFESSDPSSSLKPLLDNMGSKTYSYDALNDKTNAELTFLAAEALKDYLKTQNENDLRDYAAINHVRMAALSPDSSVYENNIGLQGMLESYIGWRGVHLEAVIPDFEEKVVNNFSYTYMPKLPDLDAVHRDLASGHLFSSYVYEVQDQISAHYHKQDFFGPVIGAALDKVYPQWKDTLVTSGKGLDQLLESHYTMTDSEINGRLDQAKERYHFNDIVTAIDQVMDPYIKTLKKKQDAYQNQPGTEIMITVNERTGFDSSTLSPVKHPDFIKAYELLIDRKQTLYVNGRKDLADDNRVNLYFGEIQPWAQPVVVLNNVPLFYSIQGNNDNGQTGDTFQTLKFKLATNSQLVIDGNSVNWGDLGAEERSFNSLIMVKYDLPESSQEVDVYHTGSIKMVDGKVQVTINNYPSPVEGLSLSAILQGQGRMSQVMVEMRK